MDVARRPFTILPFREEDERDRRFSRTRFQIRTCERCGQLTTLASQCLECLYRPIHWE
jgi:hypothetical protein